MGVEYLHFTVHPNILNIVRDWYWYEDKREKAFEFLKSLGDHMSIKLAMQLLEGDAHFITNDNGETLEVEFKDEKGFKKKIKSYLEFLENKKKATEENLRKIQMELVEAQDELENGKERYEDEDRHGEPTSENFMEEQTKQINKKIALHAHAEGIKARLKGDTTAVKACEDLASTLVNKKYEFVFEGHHYTFKDSARNQGECPHCGKASTGHFWDKKDKECIGSTVVNSIETLCFECSGCFEKFYYHKK